MKLKYTIKIQIAFILLAGASAEAQQWSNILQNPGFENNPPANWGNNVGHSIAPWVPGGGDRPNVVKVNGGIEAAWYNDGPKFDASGSPAGTTRHYLDITRGSNHFYQEFTSQGNGLAHFGGYFSTRQNRQGTARVWISRKVNNPVSSNGHWVPLNSGNVVTLLGGNSKNDPWTRVHHTATLQPNRAYRLYIHMDNDMNFDEGFVSFDGLPPVSGKPSVTHQTAGATHDLSSLGHLKPPKPNPCCPPINQNVIMRQLTQVAQPGGGSLANYRMNFAATQTFRNQMQHYIAYVNSMNPQINAIITTWRIIDRGPGPAGSSPPASGFSPVVADFHTTFSTNAQPNLGNTQGYTMKPNRWYWIHTGTYFNGDLQFFDKKKCSTSSYRVNWMVLTNKSSRSQEGVLVISDGKRILAKLKPNDSSKSRKTIPQRGRKIIPRKK